MGGHGALTIGLRHPGRYRATSAFAPIVAPSQVPWGIKALGGYLGDDKQAWRKHDTIALIEDGARVPDLLVDYGDADQFLTEQLRPELLQAAWFWDIAPPPMGYLTVLPALVLSGLMLGALGMLISSGIKQLENFAGVMNFVIFPMFFASSALYPLWRILESSPMLYYVCQFNPFTHGRRGRDGPSLEARRRARDRPGPLRQHARP